MRKYKIDFSAERIPTPSGSKFLTTYTLSTEEGRETLTPTGKNNIYDMIQADLEDSKIENVIKKVMMGDLSVLRQSEPQYIDASTMPNDMMTIQNIIVKTKQEFERMPEEVRKLFNYSAEEYVNEMGTKEFMEKMKPFNEKIEKIAMEKNAKEYERKVKEGAKLNYDIAMEQARLGEETKA